jgi:hypothetical protein
VIEPPAPPCEAWNFQANEVRLISPRYHR